MWWKWLLQWLLSRRKLLVLAWFFWYAQHPPELHESARLTLSPWFTSQARCEQARAQTKLIAAEVNLIYADQPCIDDGRTVGSGTGSPR